MKKYRRILSLLLAVLMIIPVAVPCLAAETGNVIDVYADTADALKSARA